MKTLPDSEEHLQMFTSVAPDLKRENARVLTDELYKKGWQKDKIDEFERKMGIPVPGSAAVKPAKLQYKNRMFEMEYDKDQQLLNELMNSPQFNIIYWKDNWTVDGKYRIFAIYGENLDYKKDKQ